jgi:hypothetical protein
MNNAYPSPYRKYLYMAMMAFIVMGALGLGVYLGSWTTVQQENMDFAKVYQQGFNAGSAQATNKTVMTCNSQLASLAANCKSWETPPEKLGIILPVV